MTQGKGFTLIELLVVIGILAILSTTVVVVINPAELLRQTRDTQRLADLATVRTAISIGNAWGVVPLDASGAACGAGGGTIGHWRATLPSLSAQLQPFVSSGGADGTEVSAAIPNISAIDGTGWVSVNFNAFASRIPMSKLPVDPVNTAGSGAGGASGTILDAPANLVVKTGLDNIGSVIVRLTWDAVTGADGYRVYRKLDLGSNVYKSIATVDDATLVWTDGGFNISGFPNPTNGLPYKYYVVAIDPLSVEGYPSSIASIIPSAVEVTGSEEVVFDGSMNLDSNYTDDNCKYLDMPDSLARAFRDISGNINLFATFPAIDKQTSFSVPSEFKGNYRMIGNSFSVGSPGLHRDCAAPSLSPARTLFSGTSESYLQGSEWLVAPYRIGNTSVVYSIVHSEITPTGCSDPAKCTYYAVTAARSDNGGATYSRAALGPYPSASWSPYKVAKPPYPVPSGGLLGINSSGYDAGSNIIFYNGAYFTFIKALTDSNPANAYPTNPSGQEPGACLLMNTNISDPTSRWLAWNGSSFGTILDGGSSHTCKPLVSYEANQNWAPSKLTSAGTILITTLFDNPDTGFLDFEAVTIGDYGEYVDLNDDGLIDLPDDGAGTEGSSAPDRLLNGAYYRPFDADTLSVFRPRLIGRFFNIFYNASYPVPAGIPTFNGGVWVAYPSVIDHGSLGNNFEYLQSGASQNAYLYFASQPVLTVVAKTLKRVPIRFLAFGEVSIEATYASSAGGDGSDESHFYAYQCSVVNGSPVYEINANMESEMYSTGGSKDVESTDGGMTARLGPTTSAAIANSLYEIGTAPGLSL